MNSSDLSLAPTVGPLVRQGMTFGESLKGLATIGFSSVQLDGTLSGMRARELSDRDRKDLAATVGRHGMRVAGIDLFIPRIHFNDTAHQDRAMDAFVQTMSLSADLGRVPVSVAIDAEGVEGDVLKGMLETADRLGVGLAIHGEDKLKALVGLIEEEDLPMLGCGLDPAAVMAFGGDAVKWVQEHGKVLKVGRLSDLSTVAVEQAGPRRVAAGNQDGGLDVMGYRLGCDMASGRVGPVVLDLRQLENGLTGAKIGKANWEDAAIRL
ncbi:sugar phosphate isomerase/epimerase family protein [Poriferisphaera corsica]|uniref:sugar phosphate isomerase/epimerase family protein n=1 Tax=Poriferisphaera corsica TaxID=2528020 RepID=UPI0011A37D5B|nr:hypothetical protein [Poriferisphaera corsica]